MKKFENIRPRLSRVLHSTVFALLLNLFWVYVMYFVCRVVFLLSNWQSFGTGMTLQSLLTMFRGGFLFDTSAVFYTNSLYILLVLFPLHYKEVGWYRKMTKWVYVAVNSLCMLINLADTVFFAFRRQRVTTAVFREFGGEGNIANIVSQELLSHWYLVVLLIAMVWFLCKIYRYPSAPARPLWRYYLNRSIWLAVIGFAAVCGMRGNVFFLSATRPISINYAFRYTNIPEQTGIVLNTPFSLIRTVGQNIKPIPRYFDSKEALAAAYSPLHFPADSAVVKKKNVVILIVESFGTEFIGGLNKQLEGGKYKGFTPWVDSMLDSCMYFDEMIANTYYSIDAPPAVLASIPRADRPFVVSPHSINHINSIASELKNIGYTSAFFHGADNESLGFSAFMRQAGIDRYYGQNEFYADPRFGGRKEFDGTWGVWDEPFLQFFCAELSEMPQPFVASVFTLSSHHPFRVPDKYKDRFTDEGIFELNKCIRYADYSIGRFFESARKEAWFENTIFVLCADHTSAKIAHDEYRNEMGELRIPILFYDPSGELPRGRQPGIAQQIDIMPTLLNYIGYDRPYVAFGKDLLNTAPADTWAFNWNSLPVLVKGDYLLMYDGEKTVSMYNIKTDPFEKNNLAGKGLPEEAVMVRQIQAIMQSYLERMNSDDVTVK